MIEPTNAPTRQDPAKLVKLVVWNLDHTLWDGVLLEDREPPLFTGTRAVIVGLDQLGILQSIASRNDHDTALAYLHHLGIGEYFLAPQVSWSPKSESMATITTALNIGFDSVLFVDDQSFELEEVRFAHPQVRTLKAEYACNLLHDITVRPAIVTADAPRRRLRYLEEDSRMKSEREFQGTPEEFLATLGLKLRIAAAAVADLDRAEELVIRTNQLNSTGLLYSRSQLQAFLDCDDHTLLAESLEDRFGDYGIIGIALLQLSPDLWTLRLILVSCRVLSRGIGPILLRYIAQRADLAGVALCVEVRDTGKNRPMKVALMMAGFDRLHVQEEASYLTRSERGKIQLPSYLKIQSSW